MRPRKPDMIRGEPGSEKLIVKTRRDWFITFEIFGGILHSSNVGFEFHPLSLSIRLKRRTRSWTAEKNLIRNYSKSGST